MMQAVNRSVNVANWNFKQRRPSRGHVTTVAPPPGIGRSSHQTIGDASTTEAGN
ncbi:MAG: hypothetical protein ACI9S9_001202 [Planctomycetota bacterium]|jgi:hypothetical protein